MVPKSIKGYHVGLQQWIDQIANENDQQQIWLMINPACALYMKTSASHVTSQ